MKSGKFDEELSRMNAIVDNLTPRALILFDESFAATNEREGSEIARQIVSALLEGIAQGRVRQPSVRVHARHFRDAQKFDAVPEGRQPGGRPADLQADRRGAAHHEFRRGRLSGSLLARGGRPRLNGLSVEDFHWHSRADRDRNIPDLKKPSGQSRDACHDARDKPRETPARGRTRRNQQSNAAHLGIGNPPILARWRSWGGRRRVPRARRSLGVASVAVRASFMCSCRLGTRYGSSCRNR